MSGDLECLYEVKEYLSTHWINNHAGADLMEFKPFK